MEGSPPRRAVTLTVLRHGLTDWNETGRIQGRTDRPLSPTGVEQVKQWRLSPEISGAQCYSSPLTRAKETATLLGFTPLLDDRLSESDWGDWEGETLTALRARLGPRMQINEDRGLDFRPPGGTSPRDLVDQLSPFLVDLYRRQEDAVLVCHKGIIRVLLVLATDWSMLGKPPVKLTRNQAIRFRLSTPNTLRLEETLDLCP